MLAINGLKKFLHRQRLPVRGRSCGSGSIVSALSAAKRASCDFTVVRSFDYQRFTMVAQRLQRDVAVMSILRDIPIASPAPQLSPRAVPARRITSDAEAIAVAQEIAAEIAPGASERDRLRQLPLPELERISQAGLLAITVPREYGGADVRAATLAEVTAILSEADSSLGQIPQNHFYVLEGLRQDGTPGQKRRFYAHVLAGDRVGNALSEVGTKTVFDYHTRLVRDGDGLRLRGRKYYSSGAIFAHWIAVVALDEDDQVVLAFVPRDAPGLTLIDDWGSFGQRTTGSGTTILDDVPVEADAVIPHHLGFERPTTIGPIGQIIHAAVDLGIARAALADTITWVRTRARPWKDSGVERASDDPHTIAKIGDVKLRIDAAAALVERAGPFVDRATANPGDVALAEASVAVAEAKIATNDASLLASSVLFELAGSQSTMVEHNLDRHWRNARTHTVHDPVRWKYDVIGRWQLSRTLPPRHGAI
jgi:SfnB family sulfur acquisition oxidoreductase